MAKSESCWQRLKSCIKDKVSSTPEARYEEYHFIGDAAIADASELGLKIEEKDGYLHMYVDYSSQKQDDVRFPIKEVVYSAKPRTKTVKSIVTQQSDYDPAVVLVKIIKKKDQNNNLETVLCVDSENPRVKDSFKRYQQNFERLLEYAYRYKADVPEVPKFNSQK